MTKINSRVYIPKTYEDAIIDPIHSRKQKKAIEKEIQLNLEDYQIQKYNYFATDKKTVGLKQVFKFKYSLNESIAYYKTQLVVQSFF